MKITGVRYTEKIYGSRDGPAVWNNELPWCDAINSFGDLMTFQAFEILTDEGISGLSPIHVSPLPARLTEAIKGENPLNIERLWNKMHWATQGRLVNTVGAIDIALWDIVGKVTKQPVYRLLGGFRDKVPVYGSGGGLNLTKEQLVREQLWFVEQGHKALKMKVGLADPDEDVERVKAVREAIDPKIDLMLDVNNGWTVNVAIRMAKKLERYEIAWLEEPIWKMDIEGYSRLSEATEIPIATGEGWHGLEYWRRMLENKCCDVIQSDPTVCGGPTAWKKIATLAEAYGVLMAPHHKPEHSVNAQLTAAVPNGLIAEEFYPGYPIPMFEFYKGRPFQKDGWIEISQEPGFGVEFDHDRMEWYKQNHPAGTPKRIGRSRRPNQPGLKINASI
jgi:L-alanine-DL-glutamate epimerase-like enolase superfamily enzyme